MRRGFRGPDRAAIIPACVGVDIGCGMIAQRTSLTASDLPDNLHGLFVDICRAVPHGSAKGRRDIGAWTNAPDTVHAHWEEMSLAYERIVDKHPKVGATQARMQLGTLGGGNHFVEVCLDEDQRVWVMLHSGSRGAGNRLVSTSPRRPANARLRSTDSSPAVTSRGSTKATQEFDDYVEAIGWAQRYAATSRGMMLDATLAAMAKALPPFTAYDVAVNCHHNYVEREEPLR